MPHIRFASFGISSVRRRFVHDMLPNITRHQSPMPLRASASAVRLLRSRKAFGFALPHPRILSSPEPKNLKRFVLKNGNTWDLYTLTGPIYHQHTGEKNHDTKQTRPDNETAKTHLLPERKRISSREKKNQQTLQRNRNRRPPLRRGMEKRNLHYLIRLRRHRTHEQNPENAGMGGKTRRLLVRHGIHHRSG